MADEAKGVTDQIGDVVEEFKQFGNIGSSIINSIYELNDIATKVNKQFGQMRQRISEVTESIAEATPELNKMGMTGEHAAKVMGDIAEATKKNVVATAESIKEIAATSQVIGVDSERLVRRMTEVGVSFENVQENLQGGVNYVQSIGMNVGQIMQDVVDNADMLNRFNFEGGALGLTKMAAQAAMLRVDMSVASNFADQVMDPEGAIKMAAAFQRLGVNVGALADPFALMNMSINDPAGLQKSIAEMTQQFTYFDEKTQSFRINPDGIRMLKEVSKETGISFDNLTKMGLASANADRIMGQMKFGGNLSEEDQMYISSLAQLSGDTGEYVIKVKDEQGREQYKKLSEVSEEQLKATIEASKNAPKSMEDIARSQLSYQEQSAGDIAAIRNKIVGGVAGSAAAQDTVEFAGKLQKAATSAFEQMAPSTTNVKEFTNDIRDFFVKNTESLLSGKKDISEITKEFASTIAQKAPDVGKRFDDEKVTEQFMKLMEENLKKYGVNTERIKDLFEGTQEERKAKAQKIQQSYISNAAKIGTGKSKQVIEHTGNFNYTIDMKGNVPPNLKQQFEKWLSSSETREQLIKMFKDSVDNKGVKEGEKK